MNVLLLGADGQVGRLLRGALAECGEIQCVTRQGHGGDIACDLSHPDAVRSLLTRTRPDLVVNAAAYTAVDRAENDVASAMRVNAELPRVIGETMADWDGKVVHFSTDYVFDGRGSRPYIETDPTEPLGVYGRTKLMGERALAGTGVRHLVLRTAWVYGTQGHNFLTTMLRLANERGSLKVVNDQWGSPTSARLLAGSTAAIVRSWSHTSRHSEVDGIYHLTTSGCTNWWQFAQCIVDEALAVGILRSPVPVTPIASTEFPTAAARPAYSVLSCEKLTHTFSVDLPDWKSELRRTLAELA